MNPPPPPPPILPPLFSLQAFASRASIVHIDIDPAEIGKNKAAHVALHSDVLPALALLNEAIEEEAAEGKALPDFSAWREELMEQKRKWPLTWPQVRREAGTRHK